MSYPPRSEIDKWLGLDLGPRKFRKLRLKRSKPQPYWLVRLRKPKLFQRGA